jgi:hypothetical protein
MTEQPEKKFEQIPLSKEHLKKGFFGPHNLIAPFVPIFSLTTQTMEVLTESGITFDDSYDQLDRLRGAVIRLLPEGYMYSIVQHINNPIPQLEVRADVSTDNPLQLQIDSFLGKFNLTRNNVIWDRKP